MAPGTSNIVKEAASQREGLDVLRIEFFKTPLRSLGGRTEVDIGLNCGGKLVASGCTFHEDALSQATIFDLYLMSFERWHELESRVNLW